jgi:hypothetical protein
MEWHKYPWHILWFDRVTFYLRLNGTTAFGPVLGYINQLMWSTQNCWISYTSQKWVGFQPSIMFTKLLYIYMIFLVQFLENPMICVLKLASKKLSGQLIWVDETPLAGGKSSHGGTKNLTFCMSNLPKRSIRASLLSLSLFWWDFSGFYIFFLGVV